MLNVKYSLRNRNKPFSIGKTNFKDSCGSLIDTNGCIVLLVVSGYAIASINFRRYALRKGDFMLLFYDSSISLDKISSSFSTRYISLAYPLLEEAIYKPLSVCFWNMLYGNPVLHPSDELLNLLAGWWHQMEWVGNIQNKSYQEEMQKNNIRNLLLAIDTVAYNNKANILHNKSDHSWTLITRFFKLLSLHCHEVRDVRFYADKLSITTTYLYKLCKSYMLLSPKELIDKQAIAEIKSFLINTDMPVKSIASELHFDDVSYMCRYFRRLTGVSPIDYRLHNKF